MGIYEAKEAADKWMENKKESAIRQAEREKQKKRTVRLQKRNRRKARFLAALIGLAGVAGYTASQIPEYKEEAAQTSLTATKTAIAKSVGLSPDQVQIYKHTSYPSSAEGVFREEVSLDGVVFVYESRVEDGGTIEVVQDDFGNSDVVEAVAATADAQNGSVFDAMKANKVAKGIKSGKINLDMSKAKEAKDKKDNGREPGDD